MVQVQIEKVLLRLPYGSVYGYCQNDKHSKSDKQVRSIRQDEYRKLHGVESSCYVEEIEWLDYFYRRMMKREFAEQMGIRIRPFTLWNH